MKMRKRFTERCHRFLFLLTALCLFLSCMHSAGMEAAADQASGTLTGNYSILLIGSDRREGTNWNGNSDTMILVTINHDVRKIFMVSFMRDLYADIPGAGVRKLNSAFAIGGASLLIQTLGSNYGVRVDNYCAVNFESMAQIIDMFGGVTLELNQAEADIVGVPAGQVHLNGEQAVRYSRIRNVGYYDFERTERQRRILSYLYHHTDKSNITGLLSTLETILGMLDHNFSAATLLQLGLMLPVISNYELVTERIPFDGTFSISNEILIPNDLNDTRNRLVGMIYESKAAPEPAVPPKPFRIEDWFRSFLKYLKMLIDRLAA